MARPFNIILLAVAVVIALFGLTAYAASRHPVAPTAPPTRPGTLHLNFAGSADGGADITVECGFGDGTSLSIMSDDGRSQLTGRVTVGTPGQVVQAIHAQLHLSNQGSSGAQLTFDVPGPQAGGGAGATEFTFSGPAGEIPPANDGPGAHYLSADLTSGSLHLHAEGSVDCASGPA